MKIIIFSFSVLSLAYVISLSSCQKATIGGYGVPVAFAGNDTMIVLPTDSVVLDGSKSSDADGNVSGWRWTKLTGKSSVIIRNALSPTTVVANLSPGEYQIELVISDKTGLTGRDTIKITVNDLHYKNRAPIADAGSDQMINLPKNSTYLNGDRSSDSDHHKITYAWRKVSGPEPNNIISPTEAATGVTNLEAGNYYFELKVTDEGGLFAFDTVIVVVDDEFCDNSVRPLVSARLVAIGTLSETRLGMAVASAGSKIVFAGAALSPTGGENGYGSSAVDIYDITSNTWATAKLSKRRSDIAAVSSGNKIFFAGGRLGDGAFDALFSTVDIYDVSTNSWSVANLSEPRAYISAAAVGNKVFFAGGEKDWNYSTSSTLDIYDLSNDTWTTNVLSEPRAYISAVTLGNKVYFAGGHREDRWYADPTARIDIYDNSTSTWSVSSLYRPMGDIGGIAVDDKIYWNEGCNVEVKEVSSGSSSLVSLSRPGSGIDPITANGKILFFRHAGDHSDKFDIFDLNTKVWSVGILPFKLRFASIIAVKNVVYIADGNTSGQVWRLEF